MTNMAARSELIDAVTAIPVTISEIFDDSFNYLAVNKKKNSSWSISGQLTGKTNK